MFGEPSLPAPVIGIWYEAVPDGKMFARVYYSGTDVSKEPNLVRNASL